MRSAQTSQTLEPLPEDSAQELPAPLQQLGTAVPATRRGRRVSSSASRRRKMDEQAEILQLTKDKLTLQSQLDAAQDIFKAEQQAAAGWKACADDYRQKLLKAQMEIAELKQKLTLAQQGSRDLTMASASKQDSP